MPEPTEVAPVPAAGEASSAGAADAARPLLVVDAANVVGSVPDGWWLDRAGATERLRDQLVPVAEHGLPAWPTARPPEVVLVVEGAARGVTGVPGVRVVAADAGGSGDDAIVALLAAERAERTERAGPIERGEPTERGDGAGRAGRGDRPCAVVTADRELRRRVAALGADTLGPRAVR